MSVLHLHLALRKQKKFSVRPELETDFETAHVVGWLATWACVFVAIACAIWFAL